MSNDNEIQKTPDVKNEIGILNEAGEFALMQRQANVFAASQIVPTAYQNNMPNCFIALDMARRLRANPLVVMQNLYIVHGNPGWSSQFLIAMINTSGRFTPLKFKFNDDKTECFAHTTDKETGEKLEGSTVSVAMAKAEGWYDKKDRKGNRASKWPTMTQQMLMYRSAAFFARVYCPEGPMGMQTREELHDVGDLQKVEEISGPEFMKTDTPATDGKVEVVEQEPKPEPKAEPVKRAKAKAKPKVEPEQVAVEPLITEEPELEPEQPKDDSWTKLLEICEKYEVTKIQVELFLHGKKRLIEDEGSRKAIIADDYWPKLKEPIQAMPTELPEDWEEQKDALRDFLK